MTTLLRHTFLALLLLAATVCHAAEYEHILSFDSRIQVETNGTLDVVETIQVYAAGNIIQHGIYRDFPQLYHGHLGLTTRTGFNVQSVRRDGQPEDYHLADRENGVRVYIGSADTIVPTGQHTYELTYTTDRQLGFFADHDELYWNATGNGWMFPMDQATAHVTLPAGAIATNLTAYTGAQGERGRDFTATCAANTAAFTTTRRLPAENGLTIVVCWPKGMVAEPSAMANTVHLLRNNHDFCFAIGGLLLVTALYSLIAYLFGRSPRRGVIIPRYEPPENFSPAAVRYLHRMGYDNRIFAATILDLAVRGALRIRQEKGRLWKQTFTLIPHRDFDAALPPEDEVVRRELVGDGTPITLRQEYYATFQAARDQLKAELASSQKGVYFHNRRLWCLPGVALSIVTLILMLRSEEFSPAIPAFAAVAIISSIFTVGMLRLNSYLGLIFGGVVMGAGLLASGVLLIPVWILLVIVLLVVVNVGFILRLKILTPEGRELSDQIEGFKMYLGVAEKDRLNLENPPKRTPKLFETFLPYALALGVEQKWSQQFADVLAAASATPDQTGYVPIWYQGDSWTHVSAGSFASSLGSSLTGAISSASTAPGSSSGGGGDGGGGGGGSSGGGGGGGGGGW